MVKSELIKKQIVSKPKYSFDALDGCKHELWVINEESTVEKISEIYEKWNKHFERKLKALESL